MHIITDACYYSRDLLIRWHIDNLHQLPFFPQNIEIDCVMCKNCNKLICICIVLLYQYSFHACLNKLLHVGHDAEISAASEIYTFFNYL